MSYKHFTPGKHYKTVDFRATHRLSRIMKMSSCCKTKAPCSQEHCVQVGSIQWLLSHFLLVCSRLKTSLRLTECEMEAGVAVIPRFSNRPFSNVYVGRFIIRFNISFNSTTNFFNQISPGETTSINFLGCTFSKISFPKINSYQCFWMFYYSRSLFSLRNAWNV